MRSLFRFSFKRLDEWMEFCCSYLIFIFYAIIEIKLYQCKLRPEIYLPFFRGKSHHVELFSFFLRNFTTHFSSIVFIDNYCLNVSDFQKNLCYTLKRQFYLFAGSRDVPGPYWQNLEFPGIRLLLDFVPNHTSDEHPWFQWSIKKVDPYTNYYVWKDAKMVNGQRKPPTNWVIIQIIYWILKIPHHPDH